MQAQNVCLASYNSVANLKSAAGPLALDAEWMGSVHYPQPEPIYHPWLPLGLGQAGPWWPGRQCLRTQKPLGWVRWLVEPKCVLS